MCFLTTPKFDRGSITKLNILVLWSYINSLEWLKFYIDDAGCQKNEFKVPKRLTVIFLVFLLCADRSGFGFYCEDPKHAVAYACWLLAVELWWKTATLLAVLMPGDLKVSMSQLLSKRWARLHVYSEGAWLHLSSWIVGDQGTHLSLQSFWSCKLPTSLRAKYNNDKWNITWRLSYLVLYQLWTCKYIDYQFPST